MNHYQAEPHSTTGLPESLYDRIHQHIQKIYSDNTAEITTKLVSTVSKYNSHFKCQSDTSFWGPDDILLITYGDSIRSKDESPLLTLNTFLSKHLFELISTVHVLPFFPFSSDDGFSVIDYRTVNPDLGDWEDIHRIADKFKMMFDLVINHVSRESLWFYDFVSDREPACNYFIEYPAETDVSQVTRPRNSPLLVPINTHRGVRYLWATFSEDQIDLNFSNPDVLIEFVDILLGYIQHGASMIRLDAIAFLWKQLGTSCVHLPQTHEVVKLFRTIFELCFVDRILLTETNVPHNENMSYFGDADEAHMIYQFSLPPLLLHALNRGHSRYLTKWASELPELDDNCTYLNFTASHDGIGLRALEGIISPKEVDELIESMHNFGGFVSMKANPDGKDSPYEINISLFSALQGTRRGIDQWQIRRFICSQTIMLGLQGIPAIYIHSLLATENDLHGVELTGRLRSINRKQWDNKELDELLNNPDTHHARVLDELKSLISTRRSEPCFHPSCSQEVLNINDGLFSFIRKASDGKRYLLAIHNVTANNQTINIQDRADLSDHTQWYDIISQQTIECILPMVNLNPYQCMWLVNQPQ